jgi:type I restriction enzyme M protein
MGGDLQDVPRRLFAGADQLWTNSVLCPDQYAQPVHALIALRQMEAKFEKVHSELAPKFTDRLKPQPSDCQARGAIYLPGSPAFGAITLSALTHPLRSKRCFKAAGARQSISW